jgi:hypothetical protein
MPSPSTASNTCSSARAARFSSAIRARRRTWDLVFAPDGIESYEAAARNAERVENFPVMSLADIIASKRAAGRRRDLAELDMLEEFRKAYEESKRTK